MTEMRKRAARALDRTWHAIGGDVLIAVAGSIEAAERINITRDEVIEAVTACGIKGGYPAMYGDDREAVLWLDSQPSEEQDRIAQEAFPFERYGM